MNHWYSLIKVDDQTPFSVCYVNPIVFNLIYNKVYFDKYKYEKIDFDNMLRFFIIFFYTDCIIYFHIKAISL